MTEVGKTVHKVPVFADNFQFQLQDPAEDCDYPENWNDGLLTQLIVFGYAIVGIGTVRDQDVPLTLEIYEDSMSDRAMLTDPDTTNYDHVAQCNIELPSGNLLVTGCTTDFEDALKIPVHAKQYGVRIFWSNLDSTDQLGFEGDDEYLIQLWPNTHFEERVLKVWRNLAFQLDADLN